MKKKNLLVVAIAVVSIVTALGARTFAPKGQLTALQSANVEALDATPVYPPGVTAVCEGSPVVYCKATCIKCFTEYESDNGGPARDIQGSCIKCGGTAIFPGGV